MKRGLLFLLLLIVAIFAIPNVSAVTGCHLNLTCPAGYTSEGFVSSDGHFSDVSPTGGVNFLYDVCCPNPWPEGTGPISFRFSTPNNTGHVSMNVSAVTNFAGEARLGTTYCRYETGACDADEACVFKVSNPDNSHIVDCNDPNIPIPSAGYDNVCCKVYENCWDGIDNDGDNYTDCADEDCFGGVNGDYPLQPQGCTNPATLVSSPLVTGYCALSYNNGTGTTNFHPDCIGDDAIPNPSNTAYYCSFGPTDDPADQPQGACCQYGDRSFWNGVSWECRKSNECGILGLRCDYYFDADKIHFWGAQFAQPNWLTEVYAGDPDDWCNTQVPDLHQPGETLGYPGSNGCCLIPKFGEINFWLDEDNVKVWG